jgi:hypothetical protein
MISQPARLLPHPPIARLLAALFLPLALAACNGGGGNDDDNDNAAPPVEQPVEAPTRNTAYLNTKAGDVIQVRIEELRPTQAAIGYDQI